MGKLAKPQRSKKHKKIKSIDPFYHGSRKDVRQENCNQKPRNCEQEVPRKLQQLGLSIDGVKSGKVGKKSKNKFLKHPDAPKKYTNIFSTPLGLKPDLKLETEKLKNKAVSDNGTKPNQQKKKKKDSRPKISQEDMNEYIDNLKPTRPFVEPFQFKRKPNESGAAFFRRVNQETDRVLTKSRIDDKFDVSDEKKILAKLTRKKGMSEKKKQRLKEKKQRKEEAVKEKKQEKLLDFNALKDKVEFGETVHAPPVISVRPKKAVVSDIDRPGLRMPELKTFARNTGTGDSNLAELTMKSVQAGIKRQPGKSIKRKSLSAIQKQIADSQRESFIDAYRQLKKLK